MLDPIQTIALVESFTDTLEHELWDETVVYTCYDEYGEIITGLKQFPIYIFSYEKGEDNVQVFNEDGTTIKDLNGKGIYIDKGFIGTGEDVIQVATGTPYLERLDKYAKFLNVVREIRLTIYYLLAKNKNNFKTIFWKEFHKIRNKDEARAIKIFLNLFFTTYNPMFDESGKQSTPFILFNFQYEFLKEATKDEMSLLVIKPRGTGFTWLKIGLDLVNMMFTKNWQGIVISRVESDLDITDDRVQTIFGRMRFAMEHFPFKLVQYGKDKQRFIKLTNGSQYMGKSSNVDSSRSMRGDMVEIEEAGVMAQLTAMVRSIKSVAKKRIIGGSVQGTDNGFYEFYQSALSDGSYKIILWKITDHPLYSAPDWLQAEKDSYGGDIAGFNQEVMADFFAGVEGQVFITLHNGFLTTIDRYPELESSPYWLKCSSIDPAFGTSKTAIWTYYFNSMTREYLYTGYYELIHTSYTKIINLMTKIGFLTDICFIDEHANKRDKDGTTLTEMLRAKGMINLVPVSNQQVLNSCFFANSLINNNKIFFLEDGIDIKHNKVSMRVPAFDKLLRYRYNNKVGISKKGSTIIDKDGKNDDAGDSFRYSHYASKYIGKGTTRDDIKGSSREEIYYSV